MELSAINHNEIIVISWNSAEKDCGMTGDYD